MSKMSDKKISVVMGVYNCAETLSQAIDSIINQTYVNWELIMCDDASTDNTYDIAKAYVERFPDKMILLQNDKNSKLAYTLNRCLEYATGEYVARMDGDDISLPTRFEKEVAYLESHPNIQLVGTAMQQFNDVDGDIQVIYKPEHTDKRIMHKCIPFNHATIMTYKSVYDQLGGYTVSERTKRGQDYDLWFRFFAQGFTGDNIQEPLYKVREDMNAIKRRTFKTRWEVFQTTKYGYNLLGYPRTWLAKEFCITLVKSLIPLKTQYLFRKIQQKHNR